MAVDFKQHFCASVTKMDKGKTRSTHVTKSNMAARAGLVEYRVTFASLGAVCSVLVDHVGGCSKLDRRSL